MSLLRTITIGFVGLCLASGLTSLENRLYAEEDVIYVPRDYTTIQAAIDAVEDAVMVLVAPGEYDINEPITFRGKNITLKSEEGADKTIIQMKNPLYPNGNVFVFENGENDDAVLDGFMITGGYTDHGGGICCKNSSPTIRRNIIQKNYADYGGGGIACINANPKIINNIILKNAADENGGGIYCENSDSEIQENIIKENANYNCSGGGIYVALSSPVQISRNYIIDNWTYEGTGGIFCWNNAQTSARIENNIIVKNRSGEYGSGITCGGNVWIFGNTIVENSAGYASGGVLGWEDNLLVNNIIYGNTPTDLSGIQLSQVYYSDISQEGFAGINGNISADPLLVNPDPNSNTLDNLINRGDFDGAMKYVTRCFSLQQDSPCIDAGDPAYDEVGPDRTVADIGAIYFDQRTCNRSDLYHDGFINFSDYARFASNWMKTYPGLEGDIYIDNNGDEKDLEILTENWLRGCED